MRHVLTSLALAAGAFTAVACGAQTNTAAPMPPARGPAAMLMRADTNGDGVVTKAEFIAQADARFDAMDTNHDGKVTAEERDAARTAMRDRMNADGKAAAAPRGAGGGRGGFGRGMDRDGDGIVTKADYEARAATRFDRMDANHDGRIDRTELANLAEMRRIDRRERGSDTPPPPPPPGE